ncbi:hypothetical protein B0H10DRAFT_2428835 [Mycena sp. CBHHK59/15]|nr:hypothetical protein B0H10DRAFT_2428835 [Mycena sp. CBHHK59/15]
MASASTPVTRSRRRNREEGHEATPRPDPPKRRKKIGVAKASTSSLSATSPSTTMARIRTVEHLVRDPEFYRADGDCIIRVDHTLFKARSSRVLIITIPTFLQRRWQKHVRPSAAGNVAEGKDDGNPIQLAGDTLDELRAFFGYAYASPRSLQFKNIPDADLQKLIDTPKFAHKYRIESFEEWAKDAITDVTSRFKGRTLKESPDTYVSLLYLDNLCGIPALRGRVREEWLARLWEGGLWTSLSQALEVGEARRFRTFQGDVYYTALQSLNQRSAADTATVMAATSTGLPCLGDLHNLRLLTGHRSLSMCWYRIIQKMRMEDRRAIYAGRGTGDTFSGAFLLGTSFPDYT